MLYLLSETVNNTIISEFKSSSRIKCLCNNAHSTNKTDIRRCNGKHCKLITLPGNHITGQCTLCPTNITNYNLE